MSELHAFYPHIHVTIQEKVTLQLWAKLKQKIQNIHSSSAEKLFFSLCFPLALSKPTKSQNGNVNRKHYGLALKLEMNYRINSFKHIISVTKPDI